MDPCKYDKTIGELKKAIENVKEDNIDLKNCLNRLSYKIDKINEKWGERPTWSVLFVITTLSSMVVGLSVYIITNI